MPQPRANQDAMASLLYACMVGHSFSKYLLSAYYMPGIALGAGEAGRQVQTG